jgi:hypothetical protein
MIVIVEAIIGLRPVPFLPLLGEFVIIHVCPALKPKSISQKQCRQAAMVDRLMARRKSFATVISWRQLTGL